MTVRKALIFYLSVVAVTIGAAWAWAFWSDWRIGMVVMTMLVIEHVWRVVKMIRRNGRNDKVNRYQAFG
jgi:hypothetical protein